MAKNHGDGEKPEPTLELPSLFGRGKKRRQAPDPVVEPETVVEPVETTPTPRRKAERKRERQPRSRPVISPWLAAGVVGLVVGAAGTALTYAALRGCEVVRGTESCGGPGLFVLVAILILMVLGGAVLLKLLGLSEPNGTSFLAIGVTTVVLLVALMESLFSPWMFLAVPVICAASYVLAEWVTTRFVEPTEHEPGVDVR